MTTSTTLGHATFTRVNASDLKLFRVNAGVPVEDALEMVSLLQHHANQLNFDAAMSDSGERFSWPAMYLPGLGTQRCYIVKTIPGMDESEARAA